MSGAHKLHGALRRRTTFVIALALSGCGDDDAGAALPELPFEYTSAHLEIHSDIERCAGDLARWDSFIEYAAAYLGATIPQSVALYVWEPESFDGVEICGFASGGCYRQIDGIVYSSSHAVEHELVHVLTQDYASSDSFFKEGLAEALSSPTQFGQFGPVFPVQGSLQVDYASAGHFVRWLLESHDRAALIAHLNSDGSVGQFEQRYGDLGVVTAEFFATAAPHYPGLHEYPTPSFEQRAARLWSSELEFDCAHDDVRATRGGLEVIRELTIPASGFYAFWTSTGGRIRGNIKSIELQAADPVLGYSFVFPGDEIAAGPIAAGTYEIGVAAPAGVDSGVVVVWESLTTAPVFPGDLP